MFLRHFCDVFVPAGLLKGIKSEIENAYLLQNLTLQHHQSIEQNQTALDSIHITLESSRETVDSRQHTAESSHYNEVLT